MERACWIVDGPWIARNIKNASVSSDLQIQDCGAYVNCPQCSYRVDNSNAPSPWPGLPKGVKFEPTDEKVIEHLEAQWVSKDGTPTFFFNKTAKAYPTGNRKTRKIKSVRWYRTGKIKPVMVNGVQRGSKKIMVLYKSAKKRQKSEKCNWVLHQYNLGTHEDKKGEFVVSEITYQQQKQCGKRAHESEGRTTPKTTSTTSSVQSVQGPKNIPEPSLTSKTDKREESDDRLINISSENYLVSDVESADLGTLPDFVSFASEDWRGWI